MFTVYAQFAKTSQTSTAWPTALCQLMHWAQVLWIWTRHKLEMCLLCFHSVHTNIMSHERKFISGYFYSAARSWVKTPGTNLCKFTISSQTARWLEHSVQPQLTGRRSNLLKFLTTLLQSLAKNNNNNKNPVKLHIGSFSLPFKKLFHEQSKLLSICQLKPTPSKATFYKGLFFATWVVLYR